MKVIHHYRTILLCWTQSFFVEQMEDFQLSWMLVSFLSGFSQIRVSFCSTWQNIQTGQTDGVKYKSPTSCFVFTGRSWGESRKNFQHVWLQNAYERRARRQQLYPAGSAGGTSHCMCFQLSLPPIQAVWPWKLLKSNRKLNYKSESVSLSHCHRGRLVMCFRFMFWTI